MLSREQGNDDTPHELDQLCICSENILFPLTADTKKCLEGQ